MIMRPSRFGNRDNPSVVERPALAALRRAGWTEDDLKRRRKAAPRKIEIVRELHSKTTLPPA